MCDRKGVIYQGREGLDQWKSAHAAKTDARTLEEALKGADVFLGLSAAGALKPEMVKEMAKQPIIFAMANPDPEITPPDAKAARPDAIVATGRSDYPNQVNNVLGFPFIFRGALDVRATTINDEMKIAAAEALAELARQQVPEEVAAAYGGKAHSVRPRLYHPGAVRSAADGGRARGGRPGGDGQRRRPEADRRHGRLSHRAARAAQPDHLGAHPRLRGGARQPAPRPVRRGRGGCRAARRDRVPRRRLRHSGAGRPRRRPRPAARARRRGSAKLRGPQQPQLSARRRRWPTISTSGCSGAAICTARSSGWSTRTATSSPSLLLALGRGRRDDHRRHPPLCAELAPDPAGARSAGRA